ncbi:unnamed protein product, partial [Leptidea sinapis]
HYHGRFRAFRGSPKDWILRIRFKKFKVGTLINGTTKEPGLFCGEIEQPQTFISETNFVKIVFHADNFTDQTYFSFDSRSYCERVFRDCRLQTCYVQSAAYPGVYPRNLHCRLPYIKLYIENEEFNIDGQRCENIMTCPMRPITSGSENCPYDYIRIYDGKDESSTVIGTFCGMGKFPYSIIGTSQDLFVEFVSSPAVSGTACDEVIASWKQRAGRLRSPLNTLVYKQAPPGEDVHCLYRLVTDKRIYARVILTILSVNFKEHPYTPVSCQNCYEDRADKLIIWEPFPGNRFPNMSNSISQTTTPLPLHLAVQRSLGSCLCAKHVNTVTRVRPYRVVSSGENLNLQLIVDNAHAAASYFKNPSPLFEARYEFVHGPLCGPAVLAASSDGEIVYPHLEALGYTEPPKKIQCIWDLEIEEKRDIWLHFDSIKFASRHCDDGNIQIFLPGRIEPYLSICGENVSLARELPILSAGELGFESLDDPLVIEKEKTRSIRIVFIGSASPARAAFKIAWTGLYHLPKNSDGSLMTSKLTDFSTGTTDSLNGCDFICPGEEALCIPARLICNGVVNCPNMTSSRGKYWTAEEKQAREAYSEDSLRRLGYLDALSGIQLGNLNDESPELCTGVRMTGSSDWLAPILGACLALIVSVCALGAAWKLCCRKRSPDEESLDY